MTFSSTEVEVRNESFSDCIDRSVYQKLGCVSPWETNSTISSLPTCSTFSDFERMMTEYTTVRKLLRYRQWLINIVWNISQIVMSDRHDYFDRCSTPQTYYEFGVFYIIFYMKLMISVLDSWPGILWWLLSLVKPL